MSRAPSEPPATDYELRIKAGLSSQLPEGCELLSVSVAKANTSFQPCSATYVLAIQPKYVNQKLKATIARLLAAESLSVLRRIEKRKPKFKNVDVRGFLKSIDLAQNSIIVECNISLAGTIRVEEILKLLELDVENLASPIRRTNVQWQQT